MYCGSGELVVRNQACCGQSDNLAHELAFCHQCQPPLRVLIRGCPTRSAYMLKRLLGNDPQAQPVVYFMPLRWG